MAFPTIHEPYCLSNCVDGFPDGSLVGLLGGFHVGLRVSILTPIDAFRGGSLVGLLVGLRVSVLKLVDGFHGGSLIGLLVGLLIGLPV